MHKILFLLSLFFLFSCTNDSLELLPVQESILKDSDIPKNPNKEVFFGDLHVHSKYSFDAFLMGNTAGPHEAYRFAKGGKLTNGFGFDMQLKEPLDFYAVTDHGVWLGIVPEFADPNSKLGKLPGTEPFHNINSPENMDLKTAFSRVGLFRGDYSNLVRTRGSYFNQLKAYLTSNLALGSRYFDYDAHLSAWKDTIKAAEDNYEPGKFTTFLAYEWTVTSPGPESASYHRNVVFDSKFAPKRPFTRLDSIRPEDLWSWQDKLRDKGLDSIAIPHNSNQSNGEVFKMDYSNGRPIDLEYSNLRLRNEPLVEITQVKGTSETHPKLSPNDEWADFEILNTRKGNTSRYSLVNGSYVREALSNGLALKSEGRGNPFKIGFIGSTDTHTSASSIEEDNYFGSNPIATIPEYRGAIENTNTSTPEFVIPTYANNRGMQFGASGLAAVWAENNTRDAIFSSFKRRETYGTSGNKILLRFFAGYDLEQGDLNSKDPISIFYKKGVPMGSDLIQKKEAQPVFVAWAQKDKNGAPLQRIQIIKGWYDDSWRKQTNEKVYDITCSNGLKVDPSTHRCPDNGASVNLETCEITPNKGNSELKVLWKDPEFNPNIDAFYYVRVLENPTCRWSTWDAIRRGLKPREEFPAVIQERAWSSPIWYLTDKS